MSDENVEILQRAIAALNRRDIDQVLTEADDFNSPFVGLRLACRIWD